MSTPLFTEEQNRLEAAELALAPVGSKTHHLSTLPVTINEDPTGLVVTLHWEDSTPVTVVPIGSRDVKPGEPIGIDSWWTCVVVGSQHKAYPVGGYDLSISLAEIRRGELVVL